MNCLASLLVKISRAIERRNSTDTGSVFWRTDLQCGRLVVKRRSFETGLARAFQQKNHFRKMPSSADFGPIIFLISFECQLCNSISA
jgi:hypothetical protein